MKYDKIVRDKIPKIIESTGKKIKTEVVPREAAIQYLIKKLHEEADEFKEDLNPTELADLFTILFALIEKCKFDQMQIITVMKNKNAERGEFRNNIILKEVEDA